MEWNVKPINGHPNQPYISKETYNYFACLRNATPIDLGGLSDEESEVEEVVNTKAIKKNVPLPRENNFKQIKNTRYQPQRLSSLTSEQHKTYMDLCTKYKGRHPLNSQEHKEWMLLKELQIKVSKEQEEFMKHLKSLAELNPDRYLSLPPNADVYLKKYINKLKRRVLHFPQYYVLHDAVLLLPANVHSVPSIALVSILLEMGCVAKAFIPHLYKQRHFLVRDWVRVDRRFPCEEVEEDAHIKEISRDVNIDRLVEEFPVDVATSLSVLECLFDNHAPYFNRAWEIPVKVRKDSKGKTFVTLDDAFVSKNMTVPEKNLLFQELSLKTFLMHPKHASAYNLETRRDNMSVLNSSIGSSVFQEEGEEDSDVEVEKVVTEVESYAEHDLFDDSLVQLDDLEQGVLVDSTPIARSSLSGSNVLPSERKNDEAVPIYSGDVASESDAEDAFVIDTGHLSPIRSFDGNVDDDGDASCDDKKDFVTSGAVSTAAPRKSSTSSRLPHTSTPTKFPSVSSANWRSEAVSPMSSISLTASSKEPIKVEDASCRAISNDFHQDILSRNDEPVQSSKSRKRMGISETSTKIRVSSVAGPNATDNFASPLANSQASTSDGHSRTSSVNHPTAAESCPLDVILKEQSKMLDKSIIQPRTIYSSAADGHGGKDVEVDSFYTNNAYLKSPESYEKPSSGNVSYSLWKIGDTNLLLRDSYHGFLRKKRQPVTMIHLFPKLEYQRIYGFEQTTLSELSRMWLALKMKPEVSSVILNRIDACSSELLRQENVRLENITCSFHKSLQQLETILGACKKLEVGSYLISHTPGNPHFQIKKSTENPRGSYDLHLAYNQPEATLSAADTMERHWLPIDVNIRSSEEMTKIPCTFEPRDTKIGNKKK